MKSDFEKMGFIISLSRKLKHQKYDLRIEAYGKNKSALLSFLSRATQRIGYHKWFYSVAYTDALNKEPDTSIYKTDVALGSQMLPNNPLIYVVQWILKLKIYLANTENRR
jgi:heptosyltransferase-2